VLDTNIWIYVFDERTEVAALTKQIQSGIITPVLTPITFVEALGFSRISPKLDIEMREFFDELEMLELEREHLEQVIAWRRQGVKTKLPDLLVAACSKIADIPLLTRNEKDFISLDIRFENPWITI
jgi:predicted nucleic acid-binding protein